MSNVIRFENLVPETYVNQSRDFQMVCRLIDLAFNACKSSADALESLNHPELCPDQLLPMLSRKLGFDYQTVIYEDELRKILTCFKYLVSYKGSLRGIRGTVNLFMNIKHIYFKYDVDVNTTKAEITIRIYDEVDEKLDILSDILRYILPCGYILQYMFVKDTGYLDNVKFDAKQEVTLSVLNSINNTPVSQNGIGTDINNADTMQQGDAYPVGIINAFNTMQVVANNQIDHYIDGDEIKGIRKDMVENT